MVLLERKALFVCVHYGMSFCLVPSRNTLHHQPPFVRCIEALTRAGQSDRQLLPKAVSMFEVCTCWDNSCVIVKEPDCFLRTFYFISIMSDFAQKKYLKLEKRAFFFLVLIYVIRLSYYYYYFNKDWATLLRHSRKSRTFFFLKR
jgi:hypothetical protein